MMLVFIVSAFYGIVIERKGVPLNVFKKCETKDQIVVTTGDRLSLVVIRAAAILQSVAIRS